MRKIMGIVCISLGIICILCAIGLAGYNRTEEKHAEQIAQEILEEVQIIMEEAPTEQTVSAPAQELPAQMATVEAEGHDCIGILSIPVLSLELPVLKDWSYAKLKQAPCHYYGSCYEKNFVIAAHNYDSHFGRLTQLQEGDLIVFTDVSATAHYYEVVTLETLPADATEEMISSGFDLSLYTCTLGGGSRVTVRCSAVG